MSRVCAGALEKLGSFLQSFVTPLREQAAGTLPGDVSSGAQFLFFLKKGDLLKSKVTETITAQDQVVLPRGIWLHYYR
jgi:hypothetical protein